jgi:hypothetical protein
MQELGFDLWSCASEIRVRSLFAKSDRMMALWWSGLEMASTAVSLDRVRHRSYEKSKIAHCQVVNERAWRRAQDFY